MKVTTRYEAIIKVIIEGEGDSDKLMNISEVNSLVVESLTDNGLKSIEIIKATMINI